MTSSVTLRQPPSFRALFTRASLTGANALLLYLALVDFVGHMLVAGNYGYFRDELYYIESGRHLAAGYVDFPFAIALLAAILHPLTGDNLVALHVIPALAGACLVVVTGLMARELGGGRFAQVLAGLGTLVTAVFLATSSIFSMDILDALWWALATYIVIRLLRRDQPRLWLLFGVVAGLGLTTKLTMLFLGLGLTIALLLTPARRYLRTPWPWLGGAIALLFLLPYILWNAANGWPTPAFWVNYGGHSGGGPIGFLGNQLFAMNPFTLPLTVCGLYFYLRDAAGKPYRTLGWIYVVLYVVFTLFNAKSYFLAPAYPMLYAAGAVVLARFAAVPRRSWIRPAYVAALALTGLLFAPLTMPLLPPATYVSTYGALTSLGNNGAGSPDEVVVVAADSGR
jgi:4-amino-4-deoxy-L-arabinose transferase-like glycosyltransferase